MRIRYLRQTIQHLAIGMLFLPVLGMEQSIWIGTYISSRCLGIDLTDPFAAIEVMAATKHVMLPMVYSALPLIGVTAIFGRFFCGWICPLNTCFDWIDVEKKEQGNRRIGWQPYLLTLGMISVSALSTVPLFTILSPIGILSRIPAFGIRPEVLIVVALLAGERLGYTKFWCRGYCPVGALYGLFSRWRLWRPIVDLCKCTGCRQCDQACGMGVGPRSAEILNKLACTNCGKCIDQCPEQAVRYAFNIPRRGGIEQHEPYGNHSR